MSEILSVLINYVNLDHYFVWKTQAVVIGTPRQNRSDNAGVPRVGWTRLYSGDGHVICDVRMDGDRINIQQEYSDWEYPDKKYTYSLGELCVHDPLLVDKFSQLIISISKRYAPPSELSEKYRR